MLIGHHFGKRKPQWNFFTKTYEAFVYSSYAQLLKLITISIVIQSVLFAPVVYWIFQNYAIIESRLPAHLNLHENIQFEKKWIVGLFALMSLLNGLWNFYIWKQFLKNDSHLDHNSATSPLKIVSPDEADYQRHAS